MHAMEKEEDFMHDDGSKKETRKFKRRQMGLSCMLNTEVGAVLAVIRRPELTPLYNIPSSEDSYTTLPSSVPYDPFALSFSTFSKSGAPSALSSVLKILKFEVFDDKSSGFGGCRDDEDIASLDGDNAPQGFGFASGSICLHPRRHVLSSGLIKILLLLC